MVRVCVEFVVDGILADVNVGLGSERVLWCDTVDVTEVVIVVAVPERLIGE